MRGRSTMAFAMAMVVTVVTVVTSCGDQDERSVCDAYAQYVAAADELIEADVTDATVADAGAAFDDLAAEVAQLRAVADTQNEAVVDEMDQRLRDLINTLTPLDDDVPFAVVAEQITDDLDAARDADETLRDEFDPICTTPS